MFKNQNDDRLTHDQLFSFLVFVIFLTMVLSLIVVSSGLIVYMTKISVVVDRLGSEYYMDLALYRC